MKRSCKLAVVLACAGMAVLLSALVSCQAVTQTITPTSPPVATTEDGTIRGMVVDTTGIPVAGATVRVKAAGPSTISAVDGSFALHGLSSAEPVSLTAWASGYYNGGGEECIPGELDVVMVLEPLPGDDDPSYQWLSAYASDGQSSNCETCHSSLSQSVSSGVGGQSLPFDEWLGDAHALSARNPRFLSMYLGRDLLGNQSPLTNYAFNRDYGRFPLSADLSQPYYGPGYKLDFPEITGNCAACHLPAAAIDDAYGIDPTSVTGAETEGVLCDFCHKVSDVKLDPGTGLPDSNMPGVLSFEFLRPAEDTQYFSGPFDDVAPGHDTYSPIQQQSQYCAPCHFGKFWDTTVYNSFGEWLASPYSDPVGGKTCQDCHMPHTGAVYIALPDKGAVERDPATIFGHLMPGASSVDLLQNSVTMDVSARRQADQLIVEVTILNDRTGHHVPSDSPLREMILLVQAVDPAGAPLNLLAGPILPDWAGIGDPDKGYYAGLPGRDYAKILEDLWTGISPTAAYWNPTRIVSDNRIPAFGSDTTTYTFVALAGEPVSLQVTLIYRRAFIQLMDWKGWDVPDIVMESEKIVIP